MAKKVDGENAFKMCRTPNNPFDVGSTLFDRFLSTWPALYAENSISIY